MDENPYQSPKTSGGPRSGPKGGFRGLYISRMVPAMFGVVCLFFAYIFASSYASVAGGGLYLVYSAIAVAIASAFFYAATRGR